MTSPDQNSRDPRRDEVIAGEYVLGVLSAEDRRKVEARLRSDRAFAAMVNRWEENLSAINQELETVAAPARVYSAVERRLFDTPVEDARMTVPGNVGLWRSLAFWRSLALASLVLSAGLFMAGSGLLSPSPSPELIAELSGTESPIGLVAHYDASKGLLAMTPAAAKQDAAKSLELWLVEEGKSPVSLGVLPQSGEGTLVVPEAMRHRLTGGAALAVSVEPLGGSPSGAPTGPVIASGKARSL